VRLDSIYGFAAFSSSDGTIRIADQTFERQPLKVASTLFNVVNWRFFDS
jgi:hypothetical protein